MAHMKGWRKALNVLIFVGPTVLGIFIFSIYPIVFNAYISLTNRNQFHQTPDCSSGLNGILEPTCWGVFSKHVSAGLGTPFHVLSPILTNYGTLLGAFFTPLVLLALVRILVCFIPLIVAGRINKRLSADLLPTPSPWMVTVGGIVVAVILFLVGQPLTVNALTQASLSPIQGLLADGPSAVGLITNSGDFFVVTFRTILYVICCVPLFFICGLGLALLLNVPNLPGRTFLRVVLIVPWAASNVAIMMSLVWKFFFQESGTINQILALVFHLPATIWLENANIAFVICIIANIWYTYPFFMVTILGALQGIPSELYEAAEVDGATWGQRLMSVTLPLLRPAVIPIIVLSSISTFQMFGTVWAITAGGPSRGAGAPGATELVMVYAYKQVFQTNAFGLMGAFAVIIFIFLFGATLYSLRLTRITKGAYE
jgi:arabinogalactan oligomer / maltooligosaccharide transport system permease protein